MPVGIVSANVGIVIRSPNGTPTAVAETVTIAPARKQNRTPLKRL